MQFAGSVADAAQRARRRNGRQAELEGLDGLQLHAAAGAADQRDDAAAAHEFDRVGNAADEADAGMGAA